MKYQVFEFWHPLERVKPKIDELYTQRFDKVIMYGPHEWSYWDSYYWDELDKACYETNHELIVVTGSAEFYSDEEPKNKANVKIVTWPTHFFSRTYVHLEPIHTGFPEVNQFQHHYAFMNYQPRYWRCMLMDLVAKHKLIHWAAVTWHKPDTDVYQWKYWKPRLMQLSDKSFTQTKNQNILPIEYYQSFAQLVSETRVDTMFLSEKTVTPIFMGKPFLAASCINYHAFLEKLGFKLYDEIFDYSFDTEPDMEKRFEMLLENFKRLTKLPLSELPKLKEKVQEKLDYNKKLAYDIVFDYNLYPDVVKELVDIYKKDGTVMNGILVDMYQKVFETK